MSVTLRVLLLLVNFSTVWYAMRKIRKSQMQVQDTVFWVGLFGFTLLLAAFPALGMWMAELVGVYSPVNLVFLLIMFVLLVKVFLQSIQISQMDKKIKSLTQRIALDNAGVEPKQTYGAAKKEDSAL